MKTLITGAKGLVGFEAMQFFSQLGECVGIDNNMRAKFFGEEASTECNIVKGCEYVNKDIRDVILDDEFDLIIHAAAQPSHDYSAKYPLLDFEVNAVGTMELLESYRNFCPQAVFIYVSTNKVYGDNPNRFMLYSEEAKRYIPFTIKDGEGDYKIDGFTEMLPIDNCIHSPFGVSKLAGDLMTQEYGKYYGLKTGVFRCGCISGVNHKGVELHGFLSYLVKCAVTRKKYTIYGYKGKQVRDNIHAFDLVRAFATFYKNPRCGEVYNIGGGMKSNISILEAIDFIEKLSGKPMIYDYIETPRKGDHQWYVSCLDKFKEHYPDWHAYYNCEDIITQIYEDMHSAQISS